MLKKSGAVLLVVLYLVTVAGFAINIHFCFDRVSSISFNNSLKNCGLLLESKMKCCKDSHLDIKVKDAHQVQSVSSLAKIFVVDLSRLAFTGFHSSLQEQAVNDGQYRGPPNGIFNNKTTFIKNRIFRI